MGRLKRILNGFADQSIEMIPICLFISALCFWVALPLLSNNKVLDKTSIEAPGEIMEKTSRKNRVGQTYYVHYQFTHDYDGNKPEGYDASVATGLKYGEQAIPKSDWSKMSTGDQVVVEYLPYKGGIMSRVINPAIDWVANLLLMISAIGFLCFFLILFGKLSRLFERKPE